MACIYKVCTTCKFKKDYSNYTPYNKENTLDIVKEELKHNNYVALCTEDNYLTHLHDSCEKWVIGEKCNDFYGD